MAFNFFLLHKSYETFNLMPGANRYFTKAADRWKYILAWYFNIKHTVTSSIFFVYLPGIKVHRERSNTDPLSAILITTSMLLFSVNAHQCLDLDPKGADLVKIDVHDWHWITFSHVYRWDLNIHWNHYVAIL